MTAPKKLEFLTVDHSFADFTAAVEAELGPVPDGVDVPPRDFTPLIAAMYSCGISVEKLVEGVDAAVIDGLEKNLSEAPWKPIVILLMREHFVKGMMTCLSLSR